MIDHPSTSGGELEQRLPAASSQGFAHVRILTAINPDDPGPLGGPDDDLELGLPSAAIEIAPRAPLDDLLRAD
ncbi:hypothetical protein [Hyphomicrobium sp. CS1GBMeth3]|uniref:hypothetical protein n=1 Tax=Hyphomicrobium sp. CS1GBMeth3 TaxID=1892845 RepID=UPI0009314661|nr:hypothetical protein [Hyphomicrobium sp. CS1GBMeth3]